jgi:hypothetical protein
MTDQMGPSVQVNYVRASVRVVVDAFDGTTTFYVADPSDPVLRAWRSVFPDLFIANEHFPSALRSHCRYPADLFEAQRLALTVYHTTDPQTLYSRADAWQIPSTNPTQTVYNGLARLEALADNNTVAPYFALLRLPQTNTTSPDEFCLLSPFVSQGRENLSAFLVGRCDGDKRGELLLYRVRSGQLLRGPASAARRIRTDEQVGTYLARFQSSGAASGNGLRWGFLRAFPVGQSMVYVQPLYTRDGDDTGSDSSGDAIQTASNGSSISGPELRQVVVLHGDRVAHATTLGEALRLVFPKHTDPSEQNSDMATALRKALAHYERAQKAQRSGDWATYGKETEALGAVLRRMNEP